MPPGNGVATVGLMKRALRKTVQLWLLYPLMILLAMGAWAMSSPPGSSPDEDFHLVSAWCALGDRAGLCTPGATETTRVVPKDLIEASCYKFEPKSPGACQRYEGEVVETERGNFASYYPSGFYAVMGTLAGASIEASVISMRLLNAALYCVGLCALLFLTPGRRRRNYALGSLATLVPLGIFIVASVNPSSWAITSATLVFASSVEFARSKRTSRRIGLAVLAASGIVMGFAARADAAAYAGLAIALAVFLTLKPGRQLVLYGLGLLAVAALILVWVRTLGSAGVLDAAPPPETKPSTTGWFRNLMDLPNLYAGSFGTRDLGWLDTELRPMTWVLAGSTYVMVLFLGLSKCSWRKAVALLATAAIAVAAPLVVTLARHAYLFGAVQPRYFLPLLIIGVMIAVGEDHPSGLVIHPARSVVMLVAICLAHASALHSNLRRYLTGFDEPWFNLDTGVQWWWVWSPAAPMTVWILGAVAFCVAAAIALLANGRSAERDSATAGTRFAH